MLVLFLIFKKISILFSIEAETDDNLINSQWGFHSLQHCLLWGVVGIISIGHSHCVRSFWFTFPWWRWWIVFLPCTWWPSICFPRKYLYKSSNFIIWLVGIPPWSFCSIVLPWVCLSFPSTLEISSLATWRGQGFSELHFSALSSLLDLDLSCVRQVWSSWVI